MVSDFTIQQENIAFELILPADEYQLEASIDFKGCFYSSIYNSLRRIVAAHGIQCYPHCNTRSGPSVRLNSLKRRGSAGRPNSLLAGA